jgi:hypothetical protein
VPKPYSPLTPLESALDGLPGAIAWLALILCLVGLILAPYSLLSVSAVLAFYAAFRFAIAIFANLQGRKKIRDAEQTDWRIYHQSHSHSLLWDSVHHLVIIPNYQEPYELLQRTLTHLALSTEAKQMTVVLAMEARESSAEDKAKQLQTEFDNVFARVLISLHPDGLKGEKRCKSANQNWAVRMARRELVGKLAYNPDHIVVTTMDADTLWHPNYFSALTAYFTTDSQRYQRLWQAPIRYHANVYQINPLMRLVNAYATAFELAFLAANWWLSLPMSSYSLSLRLLEACGYWDTDVIADEWHTYIKAFGATDGHGLITPIFLPFLSYATTGKNFWEACLNRYRQSLRHGWGSKELGFALATIRRTPKASIMNCSRLIARISHDILLPGAGWIIVTIGAQVTLLVHEPIRQRLLTEPLTSPSFMLLQFALVMFTLCGVAVWHIDVLSRPERTIPRKRGENLLVLLGFVALPLMSFAFVALPLLQAQTRLLFRDNLTFHVTAKQIEKG